MSTKIESPEAQHARHIVNHATYGFAISGLCSQAVGSLIPFLRESYGFGYDVSGVLLSLVSIGNLITVLLAGVLPAYLGRRKSVLITVCWMGVSYALLASGIGGATTVMVACTMLGLARGGNATFCNTIVSTLPTDVASRGYNRCHGGYALGALISPILLVAMSVVFPVWGWRILAVILAVAAVTQSVSFATMTLPEEAPAKGKGSFDLYFFKNGLFWLGTAMMFFYISAEYAITGWMVTYFQDTGVLNPNDSQLMSSLFWLMIFVGRTVGSHIVGKVPRQRLLVIDGIGMLVCFVAMLVCTSPLPIIIALAGSGLFMATIFPTAFSLGSDSIRGNDFGCSVMTFLASIGGIVTPVVVGLVAAEAGIQAGMGLVVCVVVVLLISIFGNGAYLKLRHKEVVM